MAAQIEPESSERQDNPGEVEGRLWVSSVGASGVRYVIARSDTGQQVECDVPKDLQTAAVDALAQWVRASGTVYRDALGTPVLVKVKSIKGLPKDHDLPALDEIAGSMPDITNGLSTEQFLGLMRDANGYYEYTGKD